MFCPWMFAFATAPTGVNIVSGAAVGTLLAVAACWTMELSSPALFCLWIDGTWLGSIAKVRLFQSMFSTTVVKNCCGSVAAAAVVICCVG